MTNRDVWITGVGAVTAAGPTSRELLDMMLSGGSGVRPVTDLDSMPAGQVQCRLEHPGGRRLERTGRLLFEAAVEAWAQAALDIRTIASDRVGMIEGSALGPMAAVLSAGRDDLNHPGRSRPTDILRLMPGAGGAAFAQLHGIRGPVLQISAGSVSGACAIGEAYEKIVSGALDVAVAGGTDCPLDSSIVARFVSAGLLPAARSTAACRPFDRARQGTVLGEGAGIVILESPTHAAHRGATPRAVLCGYGPASEAHAQAAPDPSGAGVLRAARLALRENGEPGWIKAHGAGTRVGDLAEYCGLMATFGDRLAMIPVTGLKPMIGHCLGASGAIETVAAVLALERGLIPATVGTTHVDPAFPLYSVSDKTRLCEGASALLMAEGFGGRCAALFVRAQR